MLDEADIALYPFDDTLVNRCKSAFKLLELMRAGIPVVAEAVGQNAEVIVDGESGRLVAAGDAQSMARACAQLAADRAYRIRLGRGAQERLRAVFAWSIQVRELETFYFGQQR